MSEDTLPYLVNWPIRFNGELWDQGDTVDLTDDQAGPLVEAGAITYGVAAAEGQQPDDEPAKDGGGTAGPEKGPEDPNERLEAIKVAIQNLDPDDKSAFTKDGAPKVPVIEAALGWIVSGEERDQAVAALKAEAET